MALLEIENLTVEFATDEGAVRAVNGVSMHVEAGEVVAVVGESGCGKSVTAMSILGLVPRPPATISGRIAFHGRELLGLKEAELAAIRGNQIGMIFQEPMTSLNPVITVGNQIGEALRLHQRLDRRHVTARTMELLTLVGISAPQRRVNEYPHQLSGGMRQRVMIAMALACNPRLLIADEPTTALDVTVQAQILGLMRDLKLRLDSAVLLITHDLGVVAQMAQRVIVMYAGAKVEEASVFDLFAHPLHPYTLGLLAAVPRMGSSNEKQGDSKLSEIPGTVPDLRRPIVGCAFAPRCSAAREICRQISPAPNAVRPNHVVACHFPARTEQHG